MTPTERGEANAAKRPRVTTTIKESLRELSIQLSLLNHQVGAHMDLRDVDFYCLDLINRCGPLSPSALAHRAALHPATLTGILDRLQRGGWITRDRDPEGHDRRAVTLRPLHSRNAELFRLYESMNAAVERICARYADSELEVIADFLRRTSDAGEGAINRLASE